MALQHEGEINLHNDPLRCEQLGLHNDLNVVNCWACTITYYGIEKLDQ